MLSLISLARCEGLILIGGFFGIVFWKLMTGGILLDQLLEGDIRDPSSALGFSSSVSAGRVQSLLITLFTALFYLLQVLQHPDAFPSIPTGLIGTVAGSQSLYLLGKAQGLLLGRLRDFLK